MSDENYLFNNLDKINDFKNDKKTAVITDIDGTISRIVPTPMEAIVENDMKNSVKKLRDKYKFTGVMTGRSIKNAMEMMENNDLIYIGNHGLEQFKNGKIKIAPEVKEFIPVINRFGGEIRQKLKNYDCILLQDKELSFTVHYRLCDNDEIRKMALETIKGIEGSEILKVGEGRKVIEIRPPVGHNKGTILQNFILENNIPKIIYLGDDITDADAFIKLNELNEQKKVKAISIVVISKETPEYVRDSASYYVKSVDEIQEFFNWLSDK